MNKPKGGTRPIAVTDVIRRWITKAIALSYRDKWAENLGHMQYAVGTPAGVEKLIRAVESYIEGAGEDQCIGGIDSENAFNSCDRNAFMTELQTDFPELVPFFDMWYAGESDLRFFMDDGTTRTIKSSEGTQQGDPAGMFLFCLGLKKPLKNIKERVPEALVAASADDITIGTSTQNFENIWSIAEEELSKYNLRINRGKSHVYCFNPSGLPQEPHFPEGIEISNEGIVILGVPIGSEQFTSKFLQDLLTSHKKGLLSKLPKLGHSQTALILLRLCADTRVGYLNRLLNPSSAAKQAFLKGHDANIVECLQQILSLPALDGQVKAQISLPLHMGGMGVASSYVISNAAYAGSVLNTLEDV